MLGNVGGVGRRDSALALLAGGVLLQRLVRRIITWEVPVLFLASTATVTGVARLGTATHSTRR